MIPGNWKVNCKACRNPVTTGDADPVKMTDDGSPIYSASCPQCGTTTKYRRPAPIIEAPAYAPPAYDLAEMVTTAPAGGANREVRLPRVVIEAAWLVRFTLMAVWLVAFPAIAFYLLMLGMQLVAMYAPHR